MMDSATSRDTASAAQGSNPDSAAINIESTTDVAYSRSYVNFPDRDLCGPLGSSPIPLRPHRPRIDPTVPEIIHYIPQPNNLH